MGQKGITFLYVCHGLLFIILGIPLFLIKLCQMACTAFAQIKLYLTKKFGMQ